jgi:hypothetical protein
MPKRKSVDSGKLIKMVQEGTSSAEIMKKMGFKNSTQLKVAYANALIASGEVPGIAGGRGSKKIEGKSKLLKVGKRGSIIIPADIVSELGIKSDAKFTIRRSKAGLALKAA